MSKISDTFTFTQALIYAFPLYVIFCLLKSTRELFKSEKSKGEWENNKFYFHTPMHIKTLAITPDKNKKNLRIKVPMAPAKSFVQFKTEYDGGKAFIEIKPHENQINMFDEHDEKKRQVTYGIRLNKKQETVIGINCPSYSDLTVVRISMIHFTIE